MAWAIPQPLQGKTRQLQQPRKPTAQVGPSNHRVEVPGEALVLVGAVGGGGGSKRWGRGETARRKQTRVPVADPGGRRAPSLGPGMCRVMHGTFLFYFIFFLSFKPPSEKY